MRSPLESTIFIVVVVLAGGIREEVQRAFILHRFEQRLGGIYVGLVLFSLAFGAFHINEGLDASIAVGLLGLLWGLIYIKRRSAVMAHGQSRELRRRADPADRHRALVRSLVPGHLAIALAVNRDPLMVHRSEAAVLGSFALVCVFVLSLPLVTTRIYASDEVESFAWLRSWVFDRDVNFENEYQHFYDSRQVQTASFHETFLERENEAGRRLNFMPIGTAILWLPFYGAGHLAAIATGAPTDGFSAPYVAAVAYGSAIYGFLAVVLSLGIARRLVGHGLAASLAIWIGTPLLFYMYVAPPMSHACSAFAVSLFLWTWLHVRERWNLRGVGRARASRAR